MLRQNPPAERIDLAERHCLKPARALEPQAEAANAREKVKDFELAHPLTLLA
jgi:hypothetical protein